MHQGSHRHPASEDAPSLEGLFRVLVRRLRLLVACRGAALTLAAVLLLIVASCAADWWFRLDPPWLRVILAFTIIAGGGWLAWRLGLRPWVRCCDPVDVALQIERLRPEWRDALASSVEFSAGAFDAQQGAPALQRQVVKRTLARWRAAEARSIVDTRPCRRAVGLAAGACLLAVMAAAPDPGRAAMALHRLVSPFESPRWPQQYQLLLLDGSFRPLTGPEQPLHFPAGAPITIYVDDPSAGLPDDVTLHLAQGGRPARSIPLQPVTVADVAGHRRTVCQALLPADPLGCRFRLTGGDDRDMPWYRATFSPAPDVRELQATLTPPPYLGRPPTTHVIDRGLLEDFVGTRVRLDMAVNVPLKSAVFRRDGRPPQELPLSPDGRKFSVEFEIKDPGRFSYWFDLTDRHELRNDAPRRSEVRGIEDTAPVVAIEFPAADLTATACANLPLRIVARDDVNVTQARLVLSDPPGSVGERAVPFSLQPDQHAELETTLPVADLALAPGRQLSFRAEAEDAFDLGPRHVGKSSSRQLTIVTAEEKQGELLARQTGLVQGLETASELQSRSLQQTRELRLQWQAAQSLQPEDVDLLKRVAHDQSRIVAHLRDEQRGVAPHAEAILAEFRWNKIDDPAAEQRLQRLLDEVSRLHSDVFPVSAQAIDRARKQIEAETTADVPAEVESSLATVAAAQGEAADTLEALLVLFADWQRQYDLNRRAEEIVGSQEQIHADTAAAGRRTLTRPFAILSPQDQADLARLGERQTQLSGSVQRFAADIERLLSEAEQSGQGLSASDLRDALDILRGRSVAEQMRRTGELINDNKIGESLSAQQQVRQWLAELEQVLRGLGTPDPETLLKRVREAEQEVETLRQQQVDAIRQTRALAGDGPKAVDGRFDALLRQQRALAGQTEDSARRLRRQQLHHPAGSVSQAADAMLRAAELLEDEAGPESLDDQQAALDRLHQAQRELADVRRQLELSRSAARLAELEALVRTLADRQQSLRDETVRLDGQRQERGSLSRSQLSTLRQLTESQAQLARDVEPLQHSVADAPVLLAALAAAADDMRLAATRLAERNVDAGTQAAQDAAVRRLNELHAALAEARLERPSPESAPSAPDRQYDSDRDPTLFAQVRLIARMQADLSRRTASLTELARRTPELNSQQRADIAQLADDQARLTELLAGLQAGSPSAPGPATEEVPSDQTNCAVDAARDPEIGDDNAVVPPAAPLEADTPLDPAELLNRTVELMRVAHRRLAANQLDDDTVRLQKQIENQLAQLLRLAEQQAAQQPQAVPDDQPSDSSAGPASHGGGSGAQRDQTSSAGESTETPRPGDELTADEIQRRKNFATAVWGHLPPRLRDKMHGTFSERFLPQYDDLVRRYYEALATQGDEEP
jgi:hypothetical protein